MYICRGLGRDIAYGDAVHRPIFYGLMVLASLCIDTYLFSTKLLFSLVSRLIELCLDVDAHAMGNNNCRNRHGGSGPSAILIH